MRARARSRRGAPLLALLFAASACTGGSTESADTRPSVRDVQCPQDVEVQLVVQHSCLMLTVPEDRSKHAGAEIRVFVVKIVPPDPSPASDPVLVLGGDLGEAAGFGGISPLSARVHRVAYVMEPRGVGHSEPTLACPEVDGLSAEAAAAATSDPVFQSDFLSAVGACRERLVAQGIDIAAYDVQQTAADVEDLRGALGIDEWNLLSLGSNSRLILEVVREFPEHVRSLVMDSPQFPQADEATGGVTGTRDALAELFTACARDRACDRAFPDLPRTWDSTLARLDARPIEAWEKAVTGRVRVPVDAGRFLRMARLYLGGDGPSNLERLPASIAAAADGRIVPGLSELSANDPTLCSGYRPECQQDAFSFGAYLTVFCRDEAPFVDRPTLAGSVKGDVPLDAVFGNDPYLAACDAWDVPAAPSSVQEPVTTAVPALVLVGQFDSFSPGGIAREALRSFSSGYLVEVPGQTHNVLGFGECAVTIRNAWIDHPSSAPSDTGCLRDLTVRFSTATG